MIDKYYRLKEDGQGPVYKDCYRFTNKKNLDACITCCKKYQYDSNCPNSQCCKQYCTGKFAQRSNNKRTLSTNIINQAGKGNGLVCNFDESYFSTSKKNERIFRCVY